MKKLLIAFLSLATVSTFAQADDTVQSTIKNMLAFNQGQVMQLAEAFSEEQYAWRPAENIRSVGESLMHIALGNYYLSSKMGFAPPEDVDMMGLNNVSGKENIMAALKKSNKFVLEKIGEVETGSFNEEVDFGFGKFSRLSGLLIMMEHNGEHKGQLIAYARSNGVTPPWSEQQED